MLGNAVNMAGLLYIHELALAFVNVDFDTKLQYAFDNGLSKGYTPNIDEAWLEEQIWKYCMYTDDWDDITDMIDGSAIYGS